MTGTQIINKDIGNMKTYRFMFCKWLWIGKCTELNEDGMNQKDNANLLFSIVLCFCLTVFTVFDTISLIAYELKHLVLT